MSNKLLKIVTTLCIHLGILLMLEGDMYRVKSNVLASSVAKEVIGTYEGTVAKGEHYASAATWNFAFGMGLIVGGLAFHARLKTRPERKVKVRARKQPKKAPLFLMKVRV